MAIISDNKLDHEVQKMKALLERVKQTQVIFGNTFQTMPIKERAKFIKQIQSDHQTITLFIEKAQREGAVNSGTRFALENLRQSFQSQMILWRKVEKNIETFTANGAQKSPSTDAPSSAVATPDSFGHLSDDAAVFISDSSGPARSEPERAAKDYAEALSKMGHQATAEMITEFKQRLEVAYEKAKVQSGGKDLAINIVQEGTKIKVRMEPR